MSNYSYREAEINRLMGIVREKMAGLSASTMIRVIDNIVDGMDLDKVLAKKLSDKKELEKFLFKYATISIAKQGWERTKEGHIKPTVSISKKNLFTSDGEKQLKDLIRMLSAFDSPNLKKVVSNAIAMTVEKNNNDEAYYVKVEDKEYSNKKVMDTDFREIYKEYMELPQELRTKEAMLSMHHLLMLSRHGEISIAQSTMRTTL